MLCTLLLSDVKYAVGGDLIEVKTPRTVAAVAMDTMLAVAPYDRDSTSMKIYRIIARPSLNESTAICLGRVARANKRERDLSICHSPLRCLSLLTLEK